MSGLSKNKKLKKLYDLGDRITPQKWAKAIDMLSPYSPPEDALVINTSYKEAKALYESGDMKPGVYYRFTYYHNKPIVYENDDETTSYTMRHTFPINVFIDQHGNLKAKGSYTYNMHDQPNHVEFIADYTFDILAASINNSDYSEYKVFAKNDIYDEFGGVSEALRKIGIPYKRLNYDGGDIIVPSIPYVDYYDSLDDVYVLIFQNGSTFSYMENSYYIKPNHIFNETGLLYNLDYGDYTHSYLFDAYNAKGDFIKIIGDIDNKLDNHIYVEGIQDSTILRVDIKNCDIYIGYLEDSRLIYGINTFFNINYLNENLIYGDDYYDQTVYIGGGDDE